MGWSQIGGMVSDRWDGLRWVSEGSQMGGILAQKGLADGLR